MNNKYMDEIRKHYAVCETYFNQDVMSHTNMTSFLEEKNQIVKKTKELQKNDSNAQMTAEIEKVILEDYYSNR